MNRKPLIEYERAALRLQAFKILEGWGSGKPSDFKVWDLTERKRQAVLLAEWAATTP